ncbi:MAG: N-acetyltransferase [Lachnospiraceae bacterium]
MGNNLVIKKFNEVNLMDPFFDSLKADYDGFENWFARKSNENVYVQYDENGLLAGFLYLKIEYNGVDDVNPRIEDKKVLKIGTFKINAHGTKMGEQFLKVIIDRALEEQVDCCYMTTYEKQNTLIKLVERFGFYEYGTKGNSNNIEKVYLKDMIPSTGDICLDYPFINCMNTRKYILSVYPKYHSVLFPDSILKNENRGLIKDISYTNSIHKIYVCAMQGVENIKYGDILVIYRTAEQGKLAEYTSVATSVCVAEEVRVQEDFNDFDEFFNYANQYSVFDKDDLKYWYQRGNLKAIKMTYNLALDKRLTRHELITEIGLERDVYWGFFELTDEQFQSIMLNAGRK